MRFFTLTLLLLGILLTGQNCRAQKSAEEAIPLILIKEQSDSVAFERILIEQNQTKVLADPSIITIILPVSVGKAADFIKASDQDGMLIVRNRNGQLDITYKSKDGKEKSYPSILYDKLKEFEIRVNVINGKGYKQAFMIYNYGLIKKDDGPVIDIFGGQIPMEENDYSVTIETKINTSARAISGSVPFVKIDEWIVVDAKLPGGKSGKFILDTGASGGIVLKQSALPESTVISELKSVAYSEKGEIETKGKMQAADGTIEDSNFSGVAELSSFEMGDIKLNDLTISVLKEFPEFLEKHNIIGIIGINVLKLAEVMRIDNINNDKGVVKFISSDNKITSSHDYSFSLNIASNLLFIKGAIQDIPIDFLIDIGARRSVISSSLVNNNQLTYSTISKTAVIGLSGEIDDAVQGNFQEVKIDKKLFNDVPFVISPNLFATKVMGLEKSGALLGMSFFSKFRTMEIDFSHNKLYLSN